MQSARKRLLFTCVACLFGLALALPGIGLGASQARVVRLSFVEGTVMVKRPNSGEWAKAFVNTPIQQGFSVSTSSPDSFAEVQFENGSTVRLGESTQVDFTELSLEPSGDKVNRLRFDHGYATYRVMPEHGDIYTVQVANISLAPGKKTEFRTDLDDQGQLRVEVFSGNVKVTDENETKEIGKNKVLTYNTREPQGVMIAKGIVKDDWDKWTAQRERQSVLTRKDAPVGLDRTLYGWDDLGMYGEWGYFPGFGYGWAPYSAFGWSPYSAGMWNWYPSFGYTWISFEPWGWLPYHYGMWQFDPAFGWFWLPGSFGMWSPALVSWYQGPGWVGWVPRGVGGRAGCVPGTAGCMTTVPTTAVQNGMPVNAHTRIAVDTAQGRPVTRPDIVPTHLAMLSGTPLPAGTMVPGLRNSMPALPSNAGAMGSVNTMTTSRAPGATPRSSRSTASNEIATRTAKAPPTRNTYLARNPAPAPRRLLMGQEVGRDQALAGSNAGSRAFPAASTRGSKSHPQIEHLGPSLGGHYPALGQHSAGVPGFPGAASHGMAPFPRGNAGSSPVARGGGPVILSHGNSSGFGRATMNRSGNITNSGGFSGTGRSGMSPSMGAGRVATPSGGGGLHGGAAGHSGTMSSGRR